MSEQFKQQCMKCKKWFKRKEKPTGELTCGNCMKEELDKFFGELF